MMSGTDKDTLRKLMQMLYQRYGCAAVVGTMFDIGMELDREPQRVGPPRLCDIIDLDSYRSGRRR